ncbi:hypothetical protein [Rhizohabitans arisaemae]|uniref:hypothetical protein n=1 Tax=Rhizohabitans arisaemae TaxID=2720610 RepID=UPI0024B1C26F|nr:hypothetical protein [Rhizohabitans arisaemae]
MSNSKATAQRLDWSITPRGPVSATAQAALGLAALASVGDIAGVAPWWAAAASVAGVAGTVLTGTGRGPAALVYRAGCWAGAGGWLTYTLASGLLWSVDTFAALGVGAVAAGVLSPLGRTRRAAVRTAPGSSLVLRRDSRLAVEWESRIARVCRLRVTVEGVRRWESGAGYTLAVVLPVGGATRKHLETAADALAADARLPDGCGVEVAAGGHRGSAVLHVSTLNRLHENIPHPGDYRPRSILDPVELGEHRDSSIADAPLRELSGLVTGQRGSGKTNVLHVLTCEIARCRDAVVWHVDLNGGGLSQPWLHPWLEGDSPRPVIDWSASTPGDALAMVEAALAVAKDRKRSYRRLKVETNSALLPVSAGLPEIVLIVDEGGEALSPAQRDPVLRALRDGIEELQRIGRNEAVNVIVSSLRATQDMIAPNVLKQSGLRIGMYVRDDTELSYLYGWNKGLSVEDLPGPGCGYLQADQGNPRPWRAYLMTPSQIVEAALTLARTRPELDEASQRVAGPAYALRYRRMQAAFTDTGLDTEDTRTGRELAVPRPTPAPARRLTLVPGGADSWPDLVPARPAVGSADQWPDLMPHQTPSDPRQTDPGRRIPELLRRCLAAFNDAGDDRMHSESLAAALGITATTDLAALLRPLEVFPLARAFSRGGQERRGYAREDLITATERIRNGELHVPPEVAAWPAA